MDTQAATLTLRPATIFLRVDGAPVPCGSWDQAIAVLANQARIYRKPVRFTVKDADSRAYGIYEVNHARRVEPVEDEYVDPDSPQLLLGEWSLSTSKGRLARFLSAHAAEDRLHAVADTTGTEIHVDVHCLGTEGHRLHTITPAGVTNVTPALPLDEDALAEAVHDAPEEEPAEDETPPAEEPHVASEPDRAPAPDEQHDDISNENDAHPEPLGIAALMGGGDDESLEAAEDETADQLGESNTRRNWPVVVGGLLLVLLGVVLVPVSGITNSPPTPSGFEQAVATNPAPATSIDHTTIAAVSPSGLLFVDASSGETLGAQDTVATDRRIYPLTSSGFYITGDQPQVCERENAESVECADADSAPQDKTLIHRAGTVAYASEATPNVDVLTEDGTQTYHAPSSRTAYIGQSGEEALWAEATKDGGQIVTAARNGAVSHTATLEAPSDDAKILSWVGPTDQGTIAVLWSKDKDTNTLAFHDPATGTATQHAEIPAGAKGNISVTDTGSLILAKHTAVTSEAKAVPLSDLTDPKISSDAITAKNGAVAGTGRSIPTKEGQTFITDDGESAILVENDALTSTAITD